MVGLRFEASADREKVHLHLFDLEEDCMTVEYLRKQFELTEFRHYWLSEAALTKALNQYKNKKASTAADFGSAAGEPTEDRDHVTLIVAERRPAEVAIEISDDKMCCVLRVVTSFGAGNPSAEMLNAELKEFGVIEGVNYPKIESLSRSLENFPPGSTIKEIIAEGKTPGSSSAANLEFLVQPIQDRLLRPALRDDGTVDMYDFGEIPIVEVGHILIRRIPPKLGQAGFNVLGEVVDAAKPKDFKLIAGDGAAISETDENVLIATRRGVPMREGNGMRVEDAYCVQNVDLKTGNIDFDGSVVVRGSVNDGMSVKATGKVIVQDFVESAKIESGGDVIVGKGVLGRQAKKGEQLTYTAEIISGGNVNANYVQYAKIDAVGKVEVAKHIMHSHIEAETINVISPKRNEGKVLGGVLQPRKSLACNNLGAPSYIVTTVTFEALFSEDLHTVAAIDEELADRIKVVIGMEEAYSAIPRNNEIPDLVEQKTKIKNTIIHFKNHIAEQRLEKKKILERIKAKKEELEILVQGNLFPGVNIIFLNRVVPVKEEKKMCKIVPKEEGISYFTLT